MTDSSFVRELKWKWEKLWDLSAFARSWMIYCCSLMNANGNIFGENEFSFKHSPRKNACWNVFPQLFQKSLQIESLKESQTQLSLLREKQFFSEMIRSSINNHGWIRKCEKYFPPFCVCKRNLMFMLNGFSRFEKLKRFIFIIIRMWKNPLVLSRFLIRNDEMKNDFFGWPRKHSRKFFHSFTSRSMIGGWKIEILKSCCVLSTSKHSSCWLSPLKLQKKTFIFNP